MRNRVKVIVESGHKRDTYIFEDAEITDFQKVLKPKVVDILKMDEEGTTKTLSGESESIRLMFDVRGETKHNTDVLRSFPSEN